jgi:hypothetical protein
MAGGDECLISPLLTLSRHLRLTAVQNCHTPEQAVTRRAIYKEAVEQLAAVAVELVQVAHQELDAVGVGDQQAGLATGGGCLPRP